jgi:hypothetical protein
LASAPTDEEREEELDRAARAIIDRYGIDAAERSI